MRPTKFLVSLALATAVALTSAAAFAQQNYPSKPVRLIVTTAAGGPTDYMARVAAEILGKAGYQVVVDNRGAAQGVLAVSSVVKADPDGYTLLVAHASPLVIFQALLPEKPPYDALKDLTPITQLSTVASVAVINANIPAKTLTEFIEYAKKNPGKLNYSSTGTGNMPHLSGERFKIRTGIDLVHVPYNSTPQAVTALLTGEASFAFTSPDILEHVKAGKVRALATTAKKRLIEAPDVPTMDEAGLTGFTSGSWYGLYGPRGLDPAIVNKLQSDIAAGFKDPPLIEKTTRAGHELSGSKPEELAEYMKSQTAAWTEVIKSAKITMQ